MTMINATKKNDWDLGGHIWKILFNLGSHRGGHLSCKKAEELCRKERQSILFSFWKIDLKWKRVDFKQLNQRCRKHKCKK